MLKTVVLLYFCGNHDTLFFQDSLTNREFKRTVFGLFEKEMSLMINASLLNISG